MRDALYSVMIWPVGHFWQSLLLAVPGGAAAKYGWAAVISFRRSDGIVNLYGADV